MISKPNDITNGVIDRYQKKTPMIGLVIRDLKIVKNICSTKCSTLFSVVNLVPSSCRCMERCMNVYEAKGGCKDRSTWRPIFST